MESITKSKYKEYLETKMESENNLESYVANWLDESANDGYNDYDNGVEDTLNDLSTHGCVSGMVSSLIYYHDILNFYDNYENEIWELLYEMTEMMGYDNILTTISTFNGADNVGDVTQFKNLLAWFAFEETARQMGEELEIL